MKWILISLTATTLLALPMLAAGQSTPIPPEAARQSPLTQTGEQDISRPLPGQGQRRAPTTTLPRDDATYNMVARAQEELRELGYNPGAVDGIMGPRTRQALRQYQQDFDLPVTGTLNETTRQKLLGEGRASLPANWRETPPTMGRKMTGGEIQVAEQHLKDFGFDPGPVDGVFTAQTEAAVRAFQKRRGIPVSGILDDPTQRALLPGIRGGGTTSGGQ
jgi:peptidoglycan hydrolase-like protein with peptidoglycan-binding domain